MHKCCSKLFAAIAVAGAVVLAGCSYETQTTSGARYLEGYANPPESFASDAAFDGAVSDDERVRRAAAVEPNLRFPGRIGIARIEDGELTAIPTAEADAWAAMTGRLGESYGAFVPVSRLVADLAYVPPARDKHGHGGTGAHELVQKIRMGAARQHLDAVILYEVYGTEDSKMTPLAIGNLTLIGAYLFPSQKVEVVGYAEALLLDVRNGYPYGTARASVERDKLAALIGSWDKAEDLKAQAMSAAVADLAPQIADMIETLDGELKALDATAATAPGDTAAPIARDAGSDSEGS